MAPRDPPPTRGSERQAALRLLWVMACTPERSVADGGEAAAHSTLRLCRRDEPINPAIAAFAPEAVCFEIHPDDTRMLAALKLVRLEHPALPVLLLADDHSEALALAALRLRVWDLRVKPLAAGEVAASLAALHACVRGGPMLLDRVPPTQCTGRRRSTQPAVRFIDEHLDRHLSLADCAGRCNLSACEFSRRFHAEHGVSFSEYVLRLRVTRAAALLAERDRAVSEIAYAVGFNDLSYFSRVFRRFVGMPASAYRRALGRQG